MIKKADSLQMGLKPLLAKTLENALSHRIAKEFPRIGGPRICKLCAEMVMEVVNNHIRPSYPSGGVGIFQVGRLIFNFLAVCFGVLPIPLATTHIIC